MIRCILIMALIFKNLYKFIDKNEFTDKNEYTPKCFLLMEVDKAFCV